MAMILLLGALTHFSAPLAAAPLAAQEQDASPNSDARLVAEVGAIRPGEPFTVGIHVTLDEGWHTYWVSAGDAGTGMLTSWDLPEGFSVDSLEYPVPERIPYPPLLNYGYHDEVLLLARVTPPADLEPGSTVRLATGAEWLVCEDICIPARDDLALELPVADAQGAVAVSPDAQLFDTWRGRMPARSEAWTLRAARTDSGYVLAARPPADWPGSLAGAYFFSSDPGALEHTPEQPAGTADGEVRLRLPESPYLLEEPDRLEGVLKLPEGSTVDAAGHPGLLVSVPLERGEAATWALEPTTPLAAPVAQADAGGSAGLSLAAALLFALIGGVILNLMPCVFPILSLKALGFATRGGDRAGMRRDGLAFGAGVVLSFLAVAGVLMAVRASGAEVGWGYQLQSPAIVALLAALMFVIGLMLAGVV
ncbi:MAG TPA: protein-disulfide reductase DsbD domain-containing protein, partial [Longimicrobiales bacterium]|nr:protein-disulfide reductase DsbD domain-containing protein [Longimicrobiales bacterium]